MSRGYARQPAAGLKIRLVAGMLALVIVAAPVVMVAGEGSGLREKASMMLADVSSAIGSLPRRLGQGGTDQDSGDRDKNESYPLRLGFYSDRPHDSTLTSRGDGDADDDAEVYRVEGEQVPADGDRRGNNSDGKPQDNSRNFSELFSIFAMPDSKQSGSLDSSTRRTPDGMLAVDYNLGKPGVPSGAIEIKKSLHADGLDKGKVALRIINDTTILVNARQLAKAMNNQQIRKSLSAIASPDGDNSYVDFDALREAGFDVRYDPIRDAIVLASSKP